MGQVGRPAADGAARAGVGDAGWPAMGGRVCAIWCCLSGRAQVEITAASHPLQKPSTQRPVCPNFMLPSLSLSHPATSLNGSSLTLCRRGMRSSFMILCSALSFGPLSYPRYCSPWAPAATSSGRLPRACAAASRPGPGCLRLSGCACYESQRVFWLPSPHPLLERETRHGACPRTSMGRARGTCRNRLLPPAHSPTPSR